MSANTVVPNGSAAEPTVAASVPVIDTDALAAKIAAAKAKAAAKPVKTAAKVAPAGTSMDNWTLAAIVHLVSRNEPYVDSKTGVTMPASKGVRPYWGSPSLYQMISAKFGVDAKEYVNNMVARGLLVKTPRQGYLFLPKDAPVGSRKGTSKLDAELAAIDAMLG